MRNIPLVGESFRLYDQDDVQRLVDTSPLEVVEFVDKTEQVKSNTGDWVDRYYSIAKLTKK